METQKDFNYSQLNAKLDTLCQIFSKSKRSKAENKQYILKYLVQHPKALLNQEPCDEQTVIKKLSDHLSQIVGFGEDKRMVFFIIYQHLVNVSKDAVQRSKACAFLFYLFEKHLESYKDSLYVDCCSASDLTDNSLNFLSELSLDSRLQQMSQESFLPSSSQWIANETSAYVLEQPSKLESEDGSKQASEAEPTASNFFVKEQPSEGKLFFVNQNSTLSLLFNGAKSSSCIRALRKLGSSEKIGIASVEAKSSALICLQVSNEEVSEVVSDSCSHDKKSPIASIKRITGGNKDIAVNATTTTAVYEISQPFPSSSLESSKITPSDELLQNILCLLCSSKSSCMKKNLESGQIEIDYNALRLYDSQYKDLLQISKLGILHDRLLTLIERPRELFVGLCGAAFVNSLKKELSSYYSCLGILQTDIIKNVGLSGKGKLKGQLSPVFRRGENDKVLALTLDWCAEHLQRFYWLFKIADSCKMTKGGELLSVVYSFFNHNNNDMVKYLSESLLSSACEPYFKMLSTWLSCGEVDDEYKEFFLSSDSSQKYENLWTHKYQVREDMIPSFMDKDYVSKSLLIGKYINYLTELREEHRLTNFDKIFQNAYEKNPQSFYAYPEDGKLYPVIDKLYEFLCGKLLKTLIRNHKMLEHLGGLRRFILMSQNDFINQIMNLMEKKWDATGRIMNKMTIKNIVDDALTASNAKLDIPEVVKCLTIKPVTIVDGILGWDVFCLHYEIIHPLVPMLSYTKPVYDVFFGYLWKVRHLQFICNHRMWKDHNTIFPKLQGLHSELRNVSLNFYCLLGKFIQFLNQFEFYLSIDVIDTYWNGMRRDLLEAKKVETLIDIHEKFLEAIKSALFLITSRKDTLVHLHAIYGSILQLFDWYQGYCSRCLKELSDSQDKHFVNPSKSAPRSKQSSFEEFLIMERKDLTNIDARYKKAYNLFLESLLSTDNQLYHNFARRLDAKRYEEITEQLLSNYELCGK